MSLETREFDFKFYEAPGKMRTLRVPIPKCFALPCSKRKRSEYEVFGWKSLANVYIYIYNDEYAVRLEGFNCRLTIFTCSYDKVWREHIWDEENPGPEPVRFEREGGQGRVWRGTKSTVKIKSNFDLELCLADCNLIRLRELLS